MFTIWQDMSETTKVKGSGGDRGSSDETVGRDSEQEKDGAADSWPLAGIRIGARECVHDAPPHPSLSISLPSSSSSSSSSSPSRGDEVKGSCDGGDSGRQEGGGGGGGWGRGGGRLQRGRRKLEGD